MGEEGAKGETRQGFKKANLGQEGAKDKLDMVSRKDRLDMVSREPTWAKKVPRKD